MRYTFRENHPDKIGVISNLHGFLNRNLDTGFKTKWSGYWVPPYKYLDYYALKVNGLWLDGGSLEAAEYTEGEMCFHYETDSLSISEVVETPDSLPGFRLKINLSNKTDKPKALHLTMETGIDIRQKSQDLGPEKDEYDIERKSQRIKVEASDRKLVISTNTDMEFDEESYLKYHEPGEQQRCLVPGKADFMEELSANEEKQIEIEFTTDKPVFGSIKRKQQELKDHVLSCAFNNSITSMLNLVYDRNGKGIIAGHPWFQSYWARDTFWTVLGLIDAGYFELSKEVLENFAENDLSGRIGLAGEDYSDITRSDTYPLFVIAADKLRRHYGISDKIEDGMEQAMEHLEMKDGVVQHPEEGTWMDTLERSPAVDVQALWLEAAKIMEDDRAHELEIGLEEFKQENYMKDHLGEKSPRTINPSVSMMFGQVDEDHANQYLSKINAEFSSRYGARTRSMADPGYEAYGYHTGSVWGLTTGWAAAANLKYGKAKQGCNLLEKMAELVERNQPGSIAEVVNAETGELMGCPEQAWSAGMMVHVIDTYLLGIDVEEEKVVVDPAAEISCERIGKRVRGEKLDLRFENGDVEILNDPEIEVDLK